MDAIANLIESKLFFKEQSITLTLNYGLIVHGHFIIAEDFEELAKKRSYRFLTDEKCNRYKKHFSIYGVKKLSHTMIINCSELQRIDYYDPVLEPTFKIPEAINN